MGCNQNWNRWEADKCSDKGEERKESAADDDELRRELDLYKNAYQGLAKRIRELEKNLKDSK